MVESVIKDTVNNIIEWDYISQFKYQDPFNDLELDVIVTSSDNKSWRIPAFWKGGQTWGVRFMPPEEGSYRIQTICSNTEDITLHGVIDTLHVKKYKKSNTNINHNNLCVSQSHHTLTYQNGEPFFWLGDTWWMGLSKRLSWPDNFQRLAKDRQNKGFNVILLVAGLFPDMDSFDERGSNEAGFPWEKNFTRINPAYFDEADKRIQYLTSSDLIPCILGSWGYYLPILGEEKMKKHWRYLIARWSAYPVVWCIAGEATMPYYLCKDRAGDMKHQMTAWTNIGKYIRETDPFKRLITIHPTEIGRDQLIDDSILDFDMIQSGHSGYESVINTVKLVKHECKRVPAMPVIIGEVNYEGIMHDTSAEVQRLTFWSAILHGSVGYTYGANGIWQVNTETEPFGASPHGGTWGNIPWEEAAHLPGSKHIGLAKQLLVRFEWWKMAPHPEWISPKQDPLNIKTPRIAGIPEKLRIVYFYGPLYPWDQLKYKLLSLESHIAYKAFFWDPRTGDEIALGMITANEKGEWDIPPLPTFDDWILILHAVFSSKSTQEYHKVSYIKRFIPNPLKRMIKYMFRRHA